MPNPDLIMSQEQVKYTFALEPAFNAINSLQMLAWSDLYMGLPEWIGRTHAAMPADLRHTHSVVFTGLHFALDTDQSFPSFPAYIDHLAAQSGEAMRDRIIDAYMKHCCHDDIPQEDLPSRDDILSSREAYLRFLARSFPPEKFDPAVEADAYDLMVEPAHMKQVIVSHMRHMWSTYLASEWDNVQPMLHESLAALQQLDLTGLDNVEAAYRVTERKMDADEKWLNYVARFERIVFIPSAHIGPYQRFFDDGQTLWLVFGARIPSGVRVSSPNLSRADLLVRLSALTDDSRLRILALVAEEGELCAQDIITRLDLSQSAASRHLVQLTANGFLAQRRRENSKCYSLNAERVLDTTDALTRFLKIT